MPDISETLAPKSEQLDNIDLRSKGHCVFTITSVDYHPGSDQPVTVHLAEFPRPWKPGKNMRRALSECWGTETDNWHGKRVELYADEKVKFGNETPGGTRISRASHIDGPKKAAILLGQGKPGLYTVNPLPADAPTSPAVSADLLAELTAMFTRKGIPEDKWLSGVNHYTKGKATALEVITEEQARHMLGVLAEKPDAAAPDPAETDDPTLADDWQGGDPV